MAGHFSAYFRLICDHNLAEVFVFLYKDSRADSKIKSYAVGKRHWLFHSLKTKIAPLPSATHYREAVSLSLCFFEVYLNLHPKIKHYTTIRSYICHVKLLWQNAGFVRELINSSLLVAICIVYFTYSPPLLT